MPTGVPGLQKQPIRNRRSYTILFMHRSGGIFVKTRAEAYIEKLLDLGFIQIMTAHGWHHTTCFSERSGAIWTGTARELFSKKNGGINKVILAHCRMAKDG